jgi:hypothetical protein
MNTQEKEPELGEGVTSAEFWAYDGKLGRRWNVDPKLIVGQSTYACFLNNPLINVDRDGDSVINADRVRLGESNAKLKSLESKISNAEKSNGRTRKEIKASGNTDWKAIWKQLKSDRSMWRDELRYNEELKANAKRTDEIIALWKISSPDIFKAVDNATNEQGERVDFMLGVTLIFPNEGNDAFGANQIFFSKTSKYQGPEKDPEFQFALPRSEEFGKNKVTIWINKDVLVSEKDPATGQFSLNHEAGHFLYWSKNSSEYWKYYEKVGDLEGGHRSDDKSGHMAEDFGQVINCIPEK